MSRVLEGHRVNGCNEEIDIKVLDEPGQGGACHNYEIEFGVDRVRCNIDFQNGPVNVVGTNGVTHEALLAILIDRLEGFQSGDYACVENQIALNNLRVAQSTLKFRTEQRVARGVEGTHAH